MEKAVIHTIRLSDMDFRKSPFLPDSRIPFTYPKSQIRIIFRLIEFSPAGNASNISNKEALFYCFDALPMSINLYLLSLIHPGTILIGPDSEFPKKPRKQKGEKKSKERRGKRKDEHVEGGREVIVVG